MCLSYIAKKRTMPEEGTMWKVFLKTSGDNKLYSSIRHEYIPTDAWILNQDPTDQCGCGVTTETSDTSGCYYPLYSFTTSVAPSRAAQEERKKEASYEHGFHGWKRQLGAIKPYLSVLNDWKEAIDKELIEVVLKEVYYKGYIAEDSDEVVARQIYVPETASSPTKDVPIWDVNKREFIAV